MIRCLLRRTLRCLLRHGDERNVSRAFGRAVAIVFVVGLFLAVAGTAGAVCMGTTDTTVTVEDDGEPVADEPVTIVDPETDEVVEETQTGDDGTVDATLPEGEYEIVTGDDAPAQEPADADGDAADDDAPADTDDAPADAPIDDDDVDTTVDDDGAATPIVVDDDTVEKDVTMTDESVPEM